ncbi:hypothetical protein AURDEDRAFT_171319 [Auricularia subglabra TFB-10046 SS5]|nr:hypothetical protein AURDEDRAFT_171319 [Auricularia subglabra TFB-10046 SS5]
MQQASPEADYDESGPVPGLQRTQRFDKAEIVMIDDLLPDEDSRSNIIVNVELAEQPRQFPFQPTGQLCLTLTTSKGHTVKRDLPWADIHDVMFIIGMRRTLLGVEKMALPLGLVLDMIEAGLFAPGLTTLEMRYHADDKQKYRGIPGDRDTPPPRLNAPSLKTVRAVLLAPSRAETWITQYAIALRHILDKEQRLDLLFIDGFDPSSSSDVSQREIERQFEPFTTRVEFGAQRSKLNLLALLPGKKKDTDGEAEEKRGDDEAEETDASTTDCGSEEGGVAAEGLEDESGRVESEAEETNRLDISQVFSDTVEMFNSAASMVMEVLDGF